MELGDAIDRVMQLADDIAPADANYAKRRIKYTQMGQEVFDEIWNHRPWYWRVVDGTLTVAAGAGNTVTPTDFVEVGPFGGVYDSQGRLLDERSPREVHALQVGTSTTDSPSIFSFYDFATDHRPLFQIPKNGSQLVFTIYYCGSSPELVDTTTTNASYLTRLPVQYHQTPFYMGLVARALRDAGDARADGVYQGLFERGLARMVAEQQGRRSAVRRMPRTLPRGAW